MTPTCGNCKFWKQNQDCDYSEEREYGECVNDKVFGTSMSIVFVADIIHHSFEYKVPFFGKDFGCIHFTPKTEQPAVTLWAKRPYA